MDQFASALGKKDHALLLDCQSEHITHIPFKDASKVAILISNTNKKHALTGHEYSDRVNSCKDAVERLQSVYPLVSSLREASLEQLQRAFKTSTKRNTFDDLAFKRGRHVITEIERCVEASEALKLGDYSQMGKLMTSSHVSLRDDNEVSTPELDLLVDLAVGFPGVYGSRMTGGGFGGCTVTLVKVKSVYILSIV